MSEPVPTMVTITIEHLQAGQVATEMASVSIKYRV
jgi:hypothetical protein